MFVVVSLVAEKKKGSNGTPKLLQTNMKSYFL